MSADAAGAQGGAPVRVMRSRVITGIDAATLETNINEWYQNFDETTGHRQAAVLISVEPLAELAVLITYTE